MPLYDYECPECGCTVEVLESAENTDPRACPECGTLMGRQIGAPAVHFKGSGFYETDYGRKANTEEADDE